MQRNTPKQRADRRRNGRRQRGARDLDTFGLGSRARSHSLGYDAHSLDYDERFSMRSGSSNQTSSLSRCTGRAARTDTFKRCSRSLAFPTRAAGSKPRALDGQASYEEAARRRRVADAGVGPLRSRAAERCRCCPVRSTFRWSSSRASRVRQPASRSSIRTKSGRRDARRLEVVLADSCRRVSSRARVHVRRVGRRGAADRRNRRESRRFYSYDAKYEPGGSTHIVAGADRRRSRRASADARALGASAARSARLLAHRFHRHAGSAALHSRRSTRCRVSPGSARCPTRAPPPGSRSKR